MTTTTIKIIRGLYKNKGIVYVVDIRKPDSTYVGAWLFDNIKDVLKFIKECDDTKYGLPKKGGKRK